MREQELPRLARGTRESYDVYVVRYDAAGAVVALFLGGAVCMRKRFSSGDEHNGGKS